MATSFLLFLTVAQFLFIWPFPSSAHFCPIFPTHRSSTCCYPIYCFSLTQFIISPTLPISITTSAIHLLCAHRRRFNPLHLPYTLHVLLLLLLLLSGNIHPNPGPVGLSSHFTSPSCKPLNPYLTLACQNVRSISTITKTDTIFDFVTSCKLDILCLTETHLNRDKATSSLLFSLTPLNYSLFRLDRPNGLGNGGGLAIIHHTSLKPTILSLPHYDSFECLASTISAPAGSFNLVLLYQAL